MNTFWTVLSIFVLALLAGGYFVADYLTGLPEDVEKHYVGRQTCIECHQQQATLFQGSHHDRAMDEANEETVLAEFDHTLEHHGLTSRMYRDGDRFMVRTDGPDGEMTDFEVKYVFGVHPLQQYMVEMPQTSSTKEGEVGRLQILRETWDVENKSWFYLNPPDVNEKLDGTDQLHWTGITQQWNTTCAECHSTNLQKNFNLTTQSYHTTFSEIDVSCEACHGPGSLHVKLAKAVTPFWDRNHGYGLAKLKTESNLPQVEMCGTCHSRRRGIHPGFLPGDSFDEHFACNLLIDPIYHADGQIRDEDYVLGSFRQSKMFHQGIRCTDCHDPHTAKVKFKGNELCTSCHQHPAGKYDTPAHHHHAPGSPGSLCVECHMPETTYMSIDPRRDHSLRVPRPDMSIRYSTPNACTGCHLESKNLSSENQAKVSQYLDWIIEAEKGNKEIEAEITRVDQWMADKVVEWYGETSPSRTNTYYERFAKVRAEEDMETAVELMLDRGVPAIIRASSAFQTTSDIGSKSLEAALEVALEREPDLASAALLRIEAELSRLLNIERPDGDVESQIQRLFDTLMILLKSDLRNVRLTAARVLVAIPSRFQDPYVSDNDQRVLSDVFKELEASALIESERASSHLSLASLYEAKGDFENAVDSYRRAIQVEPNVAGARSNLAALLEQQVRMIQAQAQQMAQRGQREGIEALAKRSNAIANQIDVLRSKDHELLAIDVKRAEGLPGTHSLHYRFAMSSYLQKKYELTEKHLLIANSLDADNEQYLLGLATYYQFKEDYKTALQHTSRLLELDEFNRQYQQLHQDIQSALAKQEAEDNGG